MELAGAVHANAEGYEAACGMAFYLGRLKKSGLFTIGKNKDRITGTKELRRRYGVTVAVKIDPQFWYLRDDKRERDIQDLFG